MIRKLEKLILQELEEQLDKAIGNSIFYKIPKICEKILEKTREYNITIVREIAKHMLDALCREAECTTYDTSRGRIYEFRKERIRELLRLRKETYDEGRVSRSYEEGRQRL
ncbi:MAG: hypothetical protein GXO23_05555 [Crenarchaeota archaeon]|nr:hypothetical protein [Thermoproteota archaeon]